MASSRGSSDRPVVLLQQNGKALPKKERSTFATEVEAKTVVKPVQNAIAILRHLADSGEAHTATTIARVLGINTSTCFNILRTLAKESVLVFDPVAKTYKIGSGILRLASSAISEESRLDATRPYLQRYAQENGVTVCVWRRIASDRIMLVAIEHTRNNIRIHLELGQRLPILLGSTGRIMATHLGLSKAEVRAQLRQLRWFKPPNFEEYWSAAVAARDTGWAIDDANVSAGVLTVSVPVPNTAGDIPYSLTILTFRDQHRDQGINRLGQRLVNLAQNLRPILY